MSTEQEPAIRWGAPERRVVSMKAVPVGREKLEDLVIVFTEPPPEPTPGDATYSTMRRAYQADAMKIVDAMRNHIPGGLFDAILGEMLEVKRSVFQVPHE